MGLDMYLKANRYLSSYRDDEAELAEKVRQHFPELADVVTRYEKSPIKEVSAEIGYWRKANAIHKWFVDNVQEGEDDCRSYYVDRKKLQELKEICERVRDFRHLAVSQLPTASGFFFGGTEYDEWYFQDVEDTIKIIDQALSLPDVWDIEYRASW